MDFVCHHYDLYADPVALCAALGILRIRHRKILWWMMAATAQGVGAPLQTKKKEFSAFSLVATVLTIVLALLFFFPLYWAIVGALKRPNELQVIPPLLYPPVPQWQNFVEVGQVIPF